MAVCVGVCRESGSEKEKRQWLRDLLCLCIECAPESIYMKRETHVDDDDGSNYENIKHFHLLNKNGQ